MILVINQYVNWEKVCSRKPSIIKSFIIEPFGIDDENNWSELQDTLIFKMKKMIVAFEPYIRQL